MKDSKIEWTHHTFNPWIGCTRVSPGCVNCYAETMMADRYKKVKWGPTGERKRTSADYWKQPLKWNREAAAAGERRRVFCASLADVFERRPEQDRDMDEWRIDLFRLIEKTPNLDWLLLTKRPDRALIWFDGLYQDYQWRYGWGIEEEELTEKRLGNIWIGTSVENQEYADKRIPELLKIPAAVRFLSVEPLIGPVDLNGFDNDGMPWLEPRGFNGHNIDWVIVGGESGPNARPMHPEWVRSIRDQCQDAGVPFFFKQWGEWAEYSINDYGIPYLVESKELLNIGTKVTELPVPARVAKVGKHRAGRLLDGREWDEFPVVEPLKLQ